MDKLFHFKVFLGSGAPARQLPATPALKWEAILFQKITWIVLFAYTLMLLKPVVPIIEDAIAHAFWEQQHLLVVHEENGIFHVHHETVKAGDQSDRERSTQSAKIEIEDNFYIAARLIYKGVAAITCIPALAYNAYVCKCTSGTPRITSPPPKA